MLYMNAKLPITIINSSMVSGHVKSTRNGLLGDCATNPFGSELAQMKKTRKLELTKNPRMLVAIRELPFTIANCKLESLLPTRKAAARYAVAIDKNTPNVAKKLLMANAVISAVSKAFMKFLSVSN
jgi:hypothetical protein